MIDFDRANSVGLGYIKSWVPGGDIKGNEYFPINPTRGDKKPGSFAINLNTGKWMEGATFEAGGDPVSLYAYLFRAELKGATEGEIQLEAAKQILRQYDGQTISDTKFKKEVGPWAGYHCLTSGHPEPPVINYSWHAENSAKKPFEKDWDFHNKKGRVVFKVARFRDAEGKVDKPFSLWQNGDTVKWRSINLPGKKPLYNLTGLQEKQSFSVLLTEGQKNAEDSKIPLKNHFVTTCVYGNIKDVEFEPLRMRRVYIWVDPDNTGANKAESIKTKLMNLDCEVYLVRSPENREKFDISDAIDEGWSAQKLVDHIKDTQKVGEIIKEEVYLDDKILPFKVFAQGGDFLHVYTGRFRRELKLKMSGLNKNTLVTIMKRDEWAELFPGDKNINWDGAIDLVLDLAEEAPLYDSSLIRGAGAWRDAGGKIVCSTGTHVVIDGKKRDLMSVKSKYVYESAPYRPYTADNPMDSDESSKLFEIFKNISFKSELHQILLAGWTFLAPFGGVLKWRPNVWLTGSAGTGKTWVQQHIVNSLMQGFCRTVSANGSTEPGIRQALNNSAIPVTIDEMESNDRYSKEAIQLLLSMARQASTGGENSPEILKGSSDGLGMSFRINSMFFFTSILAGVEQGADMDRIEVLELVSPEFEAGKAKFKKLETLVEDTLTPDFKARFYSRALLIIEETLKAIDVFVSLSADILKSQRGGDQKGTLLAGAYMISHDESPTKEEALTWASQFDLVQAREEHVSKPDAEKCLDMIMEYHVDLNTPDGRYKQTIGMWIEDHFAKDEIQILSSHIPKHLRGYGIKINSDKTIDIACSYEFIQKILRDTSWEKTYGKLLRRHKDLVLEGAPKTARFNGSSGKGVVRIRVGDDCPF